MAYRVVPDRQGIIQIGKIKENLVTEVELPAPGFGGGSYAVLLRRPKEEQPYPVTARYEGGSLVWTVQTADTAIAGTGKLECRWYGDNGEVAKSQTYMVRITDGLPDPTEAPEAWEGYIGQVARNAQAAQTAAGEAKANAAGAAASAGIAQGAAAEAGKLAGTAGDAANAAASAASAASSAQAGAETAGQNARAAAEAAETAQSGAEAAKLAAGESATAAAGSAETAAQAAQKGESLYNQVKDDLAAGKLKGEKGEKGDPGKDAPQIDDSVVSADTPWSSRQIIDTLCPKLDETGNPVVCYPVAGYPLGVVASWEPTQAGEGEPYPAGGGPNLLDISRCTATVGKPYGLTITIDGDIIKCSGVPSEEVTSTAQYSFAVASSPQEELRGKGYKVTAWPIKGKVSNAWGLRTADESSLAIAAELSPGVDTDIQLRLMVSKDTPTAYAPYENIRPISGRDAVKIRRNGENLYDFLADFPAGYKNTVNGVTVEVMADGRVHVYGTHTSDGYTNVLRKDLYIAKQPIFPAGTYTAGNAIFFSFLGDYGKWLIKKGTFTLDKAYALAGFYIAVYGKKTFNFYCVPILVTGTTPPTTYTPYRGDKLTLALPSTIYGGSLDAVMGEGTETWKLVTLDGTENWETWGVNKNNAAVTGFYTYSINDFDPNGDKLLCSTMPFKNVEVWGGRNEGIGFARALNQGSRYIIYSVKTDTLSDASDNASAVASFKTFLAAKYAAGTPVQVAYKLAEPVPFQATENGPLLPIPGETNTIMTDADSVTVTGRADPIRIIQQLQAAQSAAAAQLDETQRDVVDTTAMTVDYIYEQDLAEIGLEEVDDSDNQTDTGAADVPGV